MDSGLENGGDETSRSISTVELNPIPPIFPLFSKPPIQKCFCFTKFLMSHSFFYPFLHPPVTPSLVRASPKIGLLRWIVRAEAGILQGRGRLQGACYKEIVLWWKWKETHVYIEYRWWVDRTTSLYWKCEFRIKILFIAISPFSTPAPPQLKKKVGPVHCSNPPLRIIWKPQAGPKKTGFTKWDADPVFWVGLQLHL